MEINDSTLNIAKSCKLSYSSRYFCGFFFKLKKVMLKKSYHPLRFTGATPLCLFISIT